MDIGAFKIQDDIPEITNPYVIAMIKPWVDVGKVGTLTLNRIERFFGATEIGQLAKPGKFFDFTRYRPNMRFVQGKRTMRIPNSFLKHGKSENGQDYLFLHLFEPHANGEEYVESILEIVKQFKVERYCRVGAMYDAVPHTRPILITGAIGEINQIRQVENLRLRQSSYQGPTTIMNLLAVGIDDLEMETLNFMAHLPQYAQLEEDYSGVSKMIEVLSSIYADIPKDLSPIRRGQRQYRELTKAVENNSELKGLIEQMESMYDSDRKSELDESQGDEASSLSPEIEDFLDEIGQQLEDDK
ncbi:MAG: PAC2 family protein [SAR202 cluster bacterium]|nr:PAC2 family protein [SAR202 cluster bacterium]MQG86172.1 PAC2 family protein [SAR202 cluster bacterium]|tara:strand:+ start:1135 stop:2034 length:900 start_codon:yes stop_codon:yes gene_type:complete